MAETGPVQVSRTYVQSRFGQLHLRIAHPETATRPPLICFHMSPMSGRIYERFLGAIGTDRIAVAADTPGFGMSDAPPAPPEIADYAAAMWDALDALGTTGPVDAMGYHTGSKIAVELALSRPERVRRVILVAAPIMTEAERQEMREHYGPKLPLPDGSPSGRAVAQLPSLQPKPEPPDRAGGGCVSRHAVRPQLGVVGAQGGVQPLSRTAFASGPAACAGVQPRRRFMGFYPARPAVSDQRPNR